MKGKILVGAGIAALFASSLGIFWSREKQVDIPEKRITFVAPFANTGYWGKAAMGSVERGRELGMDVKCIGFTKLDQAKQITYIRSAVQSRVDGIITAGMEETPEMIAAIEEARAAGIPVILIDSDIKESERNCYIGTNNYEAGRLAGEDIAKACGETGKVIAVVSYIDNMNQKQRIEGFRDVLADYPDMELVEILEGQSNEIYLQDKLVGFLEEHEDIRGVFCAEGYAANCMCRQVMESPEKYEGLNIVVFDLNEEKRQAVEEGKIYSCIEQNPGAMGERAADALWQALSGEEELSDFYTEVSCIYQDNVNQVKDTANGDVEWHIY